MWSAVKIIHECWFKLATIMIVDSYSKIQTNSNLVRIFRLYGRVRRLQIKISYAQNNQEHATEDGPQFVTTRRAVPWSGSWGSASAWIVSSLSDLPRTAGRPIPRTSSPERRKCTASNGIRACRRNTVRRTARSDHTVGGEWRWLFATHANPSRGAEAINYPSVLHLHFI